MMVLELDPRVPTARNNRLQLTLGHALKFATMAPHVSWYNIEQEWNVGNTKPKRIQSVAESGLVTESYPISQALAQCANKPTREVTIEQNQENWDFLTINKHLTPAEAAAIQPKTNLIWVRRTLESHPECKDDMIAFLKAKPANWAKTLFFPTFQTYHIVNAELHIGKDLVFLIMEYGLGRWMY